jgi:hypothetical protein
MFDNPSNTVSPVVVISESLFLIQRPPTAWVFVVGSRSLFQSRKVIRTVTNISERPLNLISFDEVSNINEII